MSTADTRRHLRARLKRASDSLKAFEVRLQIIHADDSGACRSAFPVLRGLLADTYRHIEDGVRIRERDAAAGCDLSSVWLEKTKEQRARIDALRNARPKERAADYSGPWRTVAWATHAGWKLSPAFLKSSDDPKTLAAAYLAVELERWAAHATLAATRMQQSTEKHA